LSQRQHNPKYAILATIRAVLPIKPTSALFRFWEEVTAWERPPAQVALIFQRSVIFSGRTS
jgi:hypothetical protein